MKIHYMNFMSFCHSLYTYFNSESYSLSLHYLNITWVWILMGSIIFTAIDSNPQCKVFYPRYIKPHHCYSIPLEQWTVMSSWLNLAYQKATPNLAYQKATPVTEVRYYRLNFPRFLSETSDLHQQSIKALFRTSLYLLLFSSVSVCWFYSYFRSKIQIIYQCK